MRLGWLVAALLAAGCAHKADLPAVRGAELAPHVISVSSLIEPPAGLHVWEPSVLYPTLDATPKPVPHEHGGAASRGPVRATAWLWFRAYQATFSRVDGSTCRFRPTCSGFGLEAINAHGLLGVPMTFGRLNRSHADEQHYPMPDPPFLADPIANYGFYLGEPRLDDFASYSDPAHAWYQHVRATRRMR